MLVGVAEVEADQDTRPVDVLDHVVEAVVLACRPGDPAVERERDLVGAEERVQRLGHGGAVAGVRRRVLREVRRPAQRPPARVGHRRRVAVGVCLRDCLVGAPEPVVVLGVEAGDHRVAAGDVRHRQHPRSLDEVEPVGGGKPKQAVVPHPDVVVGPEQRLRGLCRRPCRAVGGAELLDLVQVVGVFLARESVRPFGPELRCVVQRNRPHPG